MTPSKNDILLEKVRVDELSGEPHSQSLNADEQQLLAIVEQIDVRKVVSLTAEMKLTRRGELVTVAGRISAELERTCVVSLEPMQEDVNEDFSVRFTTVPEDETEGEFEADLDAPEPINADTLNLWDIALEQLVLSMTAHPRKEGATPPEDPGAGQKISPFDVLKGLSS